MNIFCDLHHGGLYYSLHLLLEKRLGHKLFRPIGTEWFEEGFWRIAEPYGNAPDTIGQFLGLENTTWDQYKNLNGNYVLEDGVYNIYDTHYHYHQKAITPDKFREMQIDVVISSYPGHDETYDLLCKTYKPEAKRVCQLGNNGQTSSGKNLLISTTFEPDYPCNFVHYHQEFDEKIFCYTPLTNHNKVTSFMNALQSQPDYQLYWQLKDMMPDFDWKSFGGGCEDGTFHDEEGIAQEMKDSLFIWQVKSQGDGYGHLPHQAAAIGRPFIYKGSYYNGQMPGRLANDDTCINIDNLSPGEIADKIRYFAKPEIAEMMSKSIRKKYEEEVNFEQDAKNVSAFLDSLI